MGVNASALIHYFLRGRDRRLRYLIAPVLGFLVCLYLWVSLSWITLAVGVCWLGLGVLYGALRTSWFRKPMDFARISTDEESTPAATRPESANR